MSEQQQPLSTRLAEFKSGELEQELLRRRCAFDKHPPDTYIYDGLGAAVSASCECGETSYSIKRTR